MRMHTHTHTFIHLHSVIDLHQTKPCCEYILYAQLLAFVAFLPRLQFFAAQSKLQKPALCSELVARRSTHPLKILYINCGPGTWLTLGFGFGCGSGSDSGSAPSQCICAPLSLQGSRSRTWSRVGTERGLKCIFGYARHSHSRSAGIGGSWRPNRSGSLSCRRSWEKILKLHFK